MEYYDNLVCRIQYTMFIGRSKYKLPSYDTFVIIRLDVLGWYGYITFTGLLFEIKN